MKKTLVTTLLASSLILPAMAQGVLSNPGFEGLPLGNVADNGGVNQWGNYNDTAGNGVIQNSFFHSGSLAFELNSNPTGTQGFSILYQNTGTSIPSVQGTWDFSFWVMTPSAGGTFDYGFFSSDSGNVDIHEAGGGGTVDAANLTANTWTEFNGSFSVSTVTSDRMKATFSDFDSLGTFYIDDVALSLEPVPEPSTLALGGLGIAALVGLRRRKYTSRG